jgi:hypothetical protein
MPKDDTEKRHETMVNEYKNDLLPKDMKNSHAWIHHDERPLDLN